MEQRTNCTNWPKVEHIDPKPLFIISWQVSPIDLAELIRFVRRCVQCIRFATYRIQLGDFVCVMHVYWISFTNQNTTFYILFIWHELGVLIQTAWNVMESKYFMIYIPKVTFKEFIERAMQSSLHHVQIYWKQSLQVVRLNLCFWSTLIINLGWFVVVNRWSIW